MAADTVFISYAREDADAALRLYQDLRSAGVQPWLDQQSLLPGQKWRSAINSAIESSRFFIALLSSQSVSQRGFVNKEIVDALEVLDTYPESDIYLIPARLDNCQPSHTKLRDLNWVDLFPDWNVGVTKLLQSIQRNASIVEAKTVESPLQIDDVIVTKGKKYIIFDAKHVAFDVRIRNTGTSTINVTRADLHILERVPLAAAYQPSASYDLLLEGEHNVIAVAHVLRPNEVDRFTLRVGFPPYNTSCGFEAELILLYNNDQRAVSKPFRFSSTF